MKKYSVFVIFAICALFFKDFGWCSEFENTPQLVVKGEASIFKPSDFMQVSLGVITQSESSSIALNENNQKMHQMIQNLRNVGLNESDYQTGHFTIQPIYQKLADNGGEDRSKIIRYEVANHLQIKTKKVALADRIISAAVDGGANQIESINFSLNNPQAYREEVIKLATQNALYDANALSNAAGVRLVRILNLSLDYWQHSPVPIMFNKRSGMGAAAANQDAIEPGEAEIRAVVNAVFEIAPDHQ